MFLEVSTLKNEANPAEDVEKLKKFYSDVFGWKIQKKVPCPWITG